MRWWVTRPEWVAHHRQSGRQNPAHSGMRLLLDGNCRITDQALPSLASGPIFAVVAASALLESGNLRCAAEPSPERRSAISGVVQHSESSTRRAAGRGAVCSPARSSAPLFSPMRLAGGLVALISSLRIRRQVQRRTQSGSPCSPPDTGTAAFDEIRQVHLRLGPADVVDRHCRLSFDCTDSIRRRERSSRVRSARLPAVLSRLLRRSAG